MPTAGLCQGLCYRLEKSAPQANTRATRLSYDEIFRFILEVTGMNLFMLNGCPFAHRATIALQEKGLTFEPVFFKRGQRPPELEALGPFARSPTLLDGEFAVWDTQVVLEYLEDRYPERPLLPPSPAERAQARMLVQRINNELAAHVNAIAGELFYKPTPDLAKVEDSRARFIASLPPWDDLQRGREFVFGNAFSLADVNLYAVLSGLPNLAELRIPEELTHLTAWLAEMACRPTTARLSPQA